ncbi:MAG TPA: 5-(carboxyamino)imidazole ribonucleotide mutase, partial [Vicinamibacteria bacterium]
TTARTSARRRWRASTPRAELPMTAPSPLVAILMGSDSDLPAMAECARVLEDYQVPYDIRVLSAHRSPEEAATYARDAAARGLRVIIAGAGGAAHLAGAMAAHSTLPVIGVPLDSSPLGGFDALLATVQMPPGVPVAAVGVGLMGAKNAAHLAVAILALQDDALRARLQAKRKKMAEETVAKAATLPDKLRKLLGGS